MFQDEDEGPKDWEIKDEEPPERLQKKWERDEAPDAQPVVCPSCGKESPAGNHTCIFCSATIPQSCCPVTCFLSWVKRLFKRS